MAKYITLFLLASTVTIGNCQDEEFESIEVDSWWTPESKDPKITEFFNGFYQGFLDRKDQDSYKSYGCPVPRVDQSS